MKITNDIFNLFLLVCAIAFALVDIIYSILLKLWIIIAVLLGNAMFLLTLDNNLMAMATLSSNIITTKSKPGRK